MENNRIGDVYISDDYIEHHGILGMKWGVRRSPAELGGLSGKVSESLAKKKTANVMGNKRNASMFDEAQRQVGYSAKYIMKQKNILEKSKAKAEKKIAKEEAKKAKNQRKDIRSDVKKMSNEEIRDALVRMDLEKRYIAAIKEQSPKKTNYGKRFVDNTLLPISEDLGKQVLKYYMSEGINKAVGTNVISVNGGNNNNNNKKKK